MLLPVLLMTAEMPPLLAMRVAPKTVKLLVVRTSLVASTIVTLPDCWLERSTRFLMPLVGVAVVPGALYEPQPAVIAASSIIPSFKVQDLSGVTLAEAGFIGLNFDF